MGKDGVMSAGHPSGRVARDRVLAGLCGTVKAAT